MNWWGRVGFQQKVGGQTMLPKVYDMMYGVEDGAMGGWGWGFATTQTPMKSRARYDDLGYPHAR